MLEKSLSILLSLIMILGVITVLPVAASATQADVPVVQVPDNDADLEVQLDAADAEWEREHGDLADSGAAADIADTGFQTYYMDVGDSKYIFLEEHSKAVQSAAWISNAPFDVEIIAQDSVCCQIKVNRYTSFTVIIECRYNYWQSNPVGGGRYLLNGSKAFYVKINEPPSSGGSSSGGSSSGGYSSGGSSSGGSSSGGSSSGGSSSSKLSKPKITGCESLDSGVNIKWNAVSGAARYRVYYKGGNGWTKMGSTTSTSFVDKAVKSGGKYTYTVRCVNAADTVFTSDFDNKGFVYTYNMATPKITSMTSSTSGVKITWGSVKNAKRYRVYYKNSKGKWVNMKELTGTSYLDSDVKYGKPYTYTVRCVRSDGGRFTSDFNNKGWKHTHYLSTPQITGCESSATGVSVKWKAVSGAQKYRVYYKNSKGSWVKMGETTGTSFLDDDVRTGKPYTYTVRCINNSLNMFMSDYDRDGYRYIYDPQLPTPKITDAEVVENGIDLTWTKAESDTPIYRVYYKSTGSWTKLGDTYDNSFTDTTIALGETRTYTVRCRTKNNKDFASDFDRTGKEVKFTHVPQLLSATYDTSDSSLFLYIEDPYNDCVDYGVWVKNGTTYTHIGDSEAPLGWIKNVSNLQKGKTYTFIVRGYDAQNRPITDYDKNGFTFTI